MLSKPTPDILSHLPTLQPDEEYYSFIVDSIKHLHTQLVLLEKESQERKDLQKEALELAAKDDISTALLTRANELTKGSPIVKLEPEQFTSIFDDHLSTYKKFEDQMKVQIVKQQDILHAIQDVYGQFSYVVANKPILNKREKAITNLEAAFTKFKEIRTNLVEGIKVQNIFNWLRSN